MLASIIYNYGKFCDNFKSTLKLGAYHTYNYWKHLLKEELASPVLPDIVPVSLPDTTNELLPMVSNYSSLTNRAIRSTEKLTINNISIEVDSAISAAFLTTLIKAVLDA